jgi:hypothetical protein
VPLPNLSRERRIAQAPRIACQLLTGSHGAVRYDFSGQGVVIAACWRTPSSLASSARPLRSLGTEKVRNSGAGCTRIISAQGQDDALRRASSLARAALAVYGLWARIGAVGMLAPHDTLKP